MSTQISVDRAESKKKGEPDWDWLKRTVGRHELVRRHVDESDLFMIYERLKKKGIRHEKWGTFVVDWACKRARR